MARLVLGRASPIVILVVLALVGAGICWFSLEKISAHTKTPTRYEMQFQVDTDGCDDQPLILSGDIGSFGTSILLLRLFDGDGNPVLVEGCQLKKVKLSVVPPLQPVDRFGSNRLIHVMGAHIDFLEAIPNENRDLRIYWDSYERHTATVVDGSLNSEHPTISPAVAPSFSLYSEDRRDPLNIRGPDTVYEVSFTEAWQPVEVNFVFEVPENIKTYFNILAYQSKSSGIEAGETTEQATTITPLFEDLEIAISFRTDDVSVIRGSIAESGDARGIDGFIRFGIENNDAESRRESANVQYSAILGIGIALIVEAFVILLALGIHALASRSGLSRELDT